MLKRVVITTGGTGGHIFPALAVAEKIRELSPECKIYFLGGESGPEAALARKVGLEFKGLPARGVLGRGIKSLATVFWLSQSLIKSFMFLRSFRPEVVIGFGGYAGFVPVLVARWLGVPTAIHEQNSLPGVTNRVLAKRVDRVFLTFPDEHGFFPEDKVVLSGNPVRPEIVSLVAKDSLPHARGKRLLVLGGSQGARAINQAVTDCLGQLKAQGIMIWHQTGKRDFEEVNKVYARKYPEARVEPFIEDMAEAYLFADLVLCRAGATTLAELCVAGKPAILIPFPYATHNHQMTNAKVLERAGAAMILVQSYLEEINLALVVEDLLCAPDKLQKMARAARSLARADAAEIIVEELEKLAECGRK
jgi:UDP-N-acetylglucosamine--N-acetylmuramyl-(pentapeptide) pyrophosphoryl-undecaprenol N-acetylglucosamine transferase